MRTVLITGVSTGIGKSIAIKLLENNFYVIGSVRKAEDAKELETLFKDKFKSIILDVTDKDAIYASVSTVKDFLEEPSRWAAILNDTKAVFDPWWSMLRSKGLLAYQLLAEQAESVDERLEIICPEMLVCSMEIDQQSPYRLCRMDVLLMSTTCLSSMTAALTFSPYMEIGMIGWKVMTLPQAYAALYLPVH